MRTRLVITILLTALAIGSLPWIHRAMDEKKDDVMIYEEVLTGNPAAAERLTVKTVTHMDQRLFWETTFQPGSEAAAVTTFKFYPGQKPYEHRYESQLRLGFAGASYGFGGTFSMEEMISESLSPESYSFASSAVGHIWKPVVDVAKRAPAREQDGGFYEGTEAYMEVVRLKDYYEYYPLAMDLYLNDSNLERHVWINEDITENNEILSEFFAVPIPEDIYLQVEIEKDSYGNVTRVDCNYTEETYSHREFLYGDNIEMGGVLMEEGAYFTLARNPEDPDDTYSVVLESPRFVDDYGIYFVPLVEYVPEGVIVEGYNPERVADMKQLRNIYPLEDGVNALGIYHDEDEDQLMLMTEEEGRLWMSIIERKTMETLQKVDMGEISHTEYVYQVMRQEDLMVTVVQDRYDDSLKVQPQRIVLLVERCGRWTREVRTSLSWPDQEDRNTFFNSPEMTRLAWDGQRLAIVQWTRYRSSCDVYVLICEGEKLKYAGVYRRRDTNGSTYDYNRMVQPWDSKDGLWISWNEESEGAIFGDDQ